MDTLTYVLPYCVRNGTDGSILSDDIHSKDMKLAFAYLPTSPTFLIALTNAR